jgi:NAD(P)-dependent dehydrogenase (short-subunit alcohol dehydrogenase family)
MKNYFIIGGASGTGKKLGQLLVESGHRVYAGYCNTKPSEEMKNIDFYPINVLDDDLQLDFLPDVLDGFAYCAGSINLKPFHRFTSEDFIADFQLQVLGAIKILKQILPRLKKSVQPSVLLFSSIAAQKGYPYHSQVSVSKGAIEGLVKSLSVELAPQIRINAIAPSLTDTPLASKLLSSNDKIEANAERHPLKRVGKVNDLAQTALFLLDDQSSWITGQIIHVDGGLSSA